MAVFLLNLSQFDFKWATGATPQLELVEETKLDFWSFDPLIC